MCGSSMSRPLLSWVHSPVGSNWWSPCRWPAAHRRHRCAGGTGCAPVLAFWVLLFYLDRRQSLPNPMGESEPAWLWIFMGFLGALSLCVTGTFALIIFVATAKRIRRRLCSRDRRISGSPAALGLENHPC